MKKPLATAFLAACFVAGALAGIVQQNLVKECAAQPKAGPQAPAGREECLAP